LIFDPFCDYKIDFKEPQNYHTLAFTLDMGDDPVGHGITIDGRELATTMTTVVLPAAAIVSWHRKWKPALIPRTHDYSKMGME
jgi:hypothetical protein